MLEIDSLDNTPIVESQIRKLSDFIKKKVDCAIFSDFRHGIFHKDSINNLRKAIKPGVFKVADSQVASRWGSPEFKDFDLLTPNEKEVGSLLEIKIQL